MLDRVLPLDVLGMIFVLAQWPSLARVSRAFYAASQSAGVRARYCLAEFGRGRVLDGALGLPARRPRMTRPDVVLLLLRLGADPRADDQWVLRHACNLAGAWTPIVRTVLHMRHQGPARKTMDVDPVSGWRGIGSSDVTSPGPLLIDVHDGDDLALRIAAGRGHTGIVNMLLDAGADAEALHGEPLALAAANAHADTVRALLGRGADAGAEHSRALRSAVLCGDANTDSVAALLDAGACVHAVDDSCLLAASYAGDGSALPPVNAARGGHIDAVRLLLAHGADVSSPAGVRALCAAARGGWPALVLVLVAAGADSTHPEFIACAQRSRPVRAVLQM
ncbi:hypothetical protein GGI01_001911 [Coemansia sp. RSA 376]|nr:hypothetical protein GGI01_001911 [Coemansia sp. RSA 376]